MLDRFKKKINIEVSLEKVFIDKEKMFSDPIVVRERWAYLKAEYLTALVKYETSKAEGLKAIMSEIKLKASLIGKEKMLK